MKLRIRCYVEALLAYRHLGPLGLRDHLAPLPSSSDPTSSVVDSHITCALYSKRVTV